MGRPKRRREAKSQATALHATSVDGGSSLLDAESAPSLEYLLGINIPAFDPLFLGHWRERKKQEQEKAAMEVVAEEARRNKKIKMHLEGEQKRKEREKETIPCRFYLQGHCEAGPTCSYRHDFDIPCKFYHLYSNCTHGDSCIYSHKPADPTVLKALAHLQAPAQPSSIPTPT
jgi:hypothetical protein